MSIRIAVFSDSINIPPKEGINVHSYDLLLALAERDDCTPLLIVCDRGWLSHEVLEQQPFDTILVPEKDFYDVNFISHILRDVGADIAQSYMTYFGAVILGPAAQDAGIPCVAELHDLEESVVNVYFAGDELTQATKIHTEFQQQAAQYASLVRIMSQHDFDIIKTKWSDFTSARYFCMPVSRFVEKTASVSQKHRVLYIGNMSYAPNAEGAEIIRDKISLLLQHEFTFIGRGSEKFANSRIEALGIVDDIEPYLAETAIGVAPILQGSGMKIKNLTYLSHGIPLITTTLGAQGFPASEAIIIEDDFSRWPSIIKNLMTKPELLARLAKIARDYFELHFEITRTTERLIELYKRAIDSYSITALQLPSRSIAKYTEVDMRHVYWLRELREAGTGAVTQATVVKGKTV